MNIQLPLFRSTWKLELGTGPRVLGLGMGSDYSYCTASEHFASKAWPLVHCFAIRCRVLCQRYCTRQDRYMLCFTIRSAGAPAPDSLASCSVRCLIYSATCAAVLGGIAMCFDLLFAAVPTAQCRR